MVLTTKFQLSDRSIRDYDPETGRFISKDPLLFGGGQVNLYGYTFNDPVDGIDPSGLSDINLYPPDSPIYIFDGNVPSIPGTISIASHGDPLSMTNQDLQYLSPQQTATLLQGYPSYRSGQPVQLNSCSTGGSTSNGSPNYAQQLANITGSTVTAPTGLLMVYSNGGTVVLGGGGGGWQTLLQALSH